MVVVIRALTRAHTRAHTNDHAAYAQRKVVRARRLLADGVLDQQIFDTMQAEAANAETAVRSARLMLPLSAGYVNPRYGGLQETSAWQRVLSPASGIVIAIRNHVTPQSNRVIKKGDVLAELSDLNSVTAKIAVSSQEALQLRFGQNIELKADAYPAVDLPGKVTFVAAEDFQTKGLTVVYAEVKNENELLKPAMRGQARIDCGRRPLKDSLLLRLGWIPWASSWFRRGGSRTA